MFLVRFCVWSLFRNSCVHGKEVFAFLVSLYFVRVSFGSIRSVLIMCLWCVPLFFRVFILCW